MSGKVEDTPPAYGVPPQHPQAAYQGGYPPQGPPYGHDPNAQNYQANPNMGYYQQGPPPQGQYPGAPYPPQQGYYPQQGYPQGQYQQQQQRGSGAEGCLGVLLGALACCCCLDCLF